MCHCRIAESSAGGSASSSSGDHHPRDEDPPVLERLTKTFDRVAAELGELVEEQDAVMRECARMYLGRWRQSNDSVRNHGEQLPAIGDALELMLAVILEDEP
jgi:hypothetical protein